MQFLIDQIRILDLQIDIQIKSVHGEIEKNIKSITYHAYKNSWESIELNKGTYVIHLNFVKISECNNCD